MNYDKNPVLSLLSRFVTHPTASGASLLLPRVGLAGKTLVERLFAPVDIASLVFFRVAFGLIMLWEVYRYFDHDWIRRYWMEPAFHFTYYGFDWVQPWPGNGTVLHFVALGVLAMCITLGLFYRVSSVLFFLGFTYIFLLEQARYLNHFYLIILISFLMIFLPAHRACSLDVLRRPALFSAIVPTWTLWLLRLQIGVVYFYGGLAKLNEDWMRGQPLQDWLADSSHLPLIGPYMTERWMAYAFSYGGLLLDLLLVPLLLWRRTRPFAFVAAVGFHLLNDQLFQIGIFPWFMIAATALFFSADWPRRLVTPIARHRNAPKPPVRRDAPMPPHAGRIVALLTVYVAFQLLFPLRHYLYPGEANWTEEGHRFSWHMKLRSKSAEATFLVTDPQTEQTWTVDPRDFLEDWQVNKMEARPDMILQFSHFLAAEMRRGGVPNVEVRADVTASLNGRPHQRLVDPTVNLAAEPRTLLPASWIVPLE